MLHANSRLFFFRFRLISTNSTQSNFLFHTLQNSRQITLHLSNFQIVSHELCTYITYLSTFHNRYSNYLGIQLPTFNLDIIILQINGTLDHFFQQKNIQLE